MGNLSQIFDTYVGRDVKIHALQQILGSYTHRIQTGHCYVLNEYGCPTTKDMFSKAAFHHMKAIIKLPRHPLDLGSGPEFAHSKNSGDNGIVLCTVEPNGKKAFVLPA